MCLIANHCTILYSEIKEHKTMGKLNLNNLIKNKMANIVVHLVGNGILISVVPGQDVKDVDADEKNIEQMILNTAIKARREIPKGGQLFISTENVSMKYEKKQHNLETVLDSYVSLSFFYNLSAISSEAMDPNLSLLKIDQQNESRTILLKVYGIVERPDGYMNIHHDTGKSVTFNILIPAYSDKLQNHSTLVNGFPLPAAFNKQIGGNSIDTDDR